MFDYILTLGDSREYIYIFIYLFIIIIILFFMYVCVTKDLKIYYIFDLKCVLKM